jgi:hypothetical protein
LNKITHIFLPLIAVLHIEVVTRPYVMSKISYFIVRIFDVKHHAAHGTILINFGSEKRSPFKKIDTSFHQPLPNMVQRLFVDVINDAIWFMNIHEQNHP